MVLSSTAALARSEWLNPAALARLLVVDRIAHAAGWAVVATGVARLVWGAKGAVWWLGQPLLWAKIGRLALMLLAARRTRRQLADWQRRWLADAALPPAAERTELRRRVVRASHLMLVLPAAAVLLARGLWTV